MLAGFVVKSCRIGGRHMRVLEHYQADILRFFDGKPAELGLYETLFARMEREFPDASAFVRGCVVAGTEEKGLAEAVHSCEFWVRGPVGIFPNRGGYGAVPGALDPSCGGIGCGADRRRVDGVVAAGLGIR